MKPKSQKNAPIFGATQPDHRQLQQKVIIVDAMVVIQSMKNGNREIVFQTFFRQKLLSSEATRNKMGYFVTQIH